MHRSRYYRNPALYQQRSETDPPRYVHGPSLTQISKNTFKRTSNTTFPLSLKRDTAPFAQKHPTYGHPRFPDRSKYVWTANKQQQLPQKQQQLPQKQQQLLQKQQQLPQQQQLPSQTSTKTILTPTPMTPSQSSTVAAQVPSTVAPVPSTTQLPHSRLVSAIKKTPVRTAVLRHNGGVCRDLGHLNVTALDEPNVVATDIALKLQEKKFYIIRKVVEVLGVKKAIKLFYETRERELKGGILIQNGKRKRTPGGVYLTLLRESSFIPKQEADMVFLEIKRYESKLKNPRFMKF